MEGVEKKNFVEGNMAAETGKILTELQELDFLISQAALRGP